MCTPLGSHSGFQFRDFPLCFDVFLRFFLVSIFVDQDRFLMDFDKFLGSFLEVVFIIFRIVGKSGKCHSDQVFIMF